MSEALTMVRTEIDVNGHRYLLALDQDPDELKQRMAAAAAAGGAFVDVPVVGGRALSVLISSATRVIFASEIIEMDERDERDDDAPRETGFVLA